MRTGSLFTGFGGLDMAAQRIFGGELAWVSDNHPSAVKLLRHRHPDVPNLGDITAVDWEQVERVALLLAGFPCTDISNAGGRAGIEGEHSGLWSYVVDAVRVLRPRHVVLENVSALLVRGLDRVAADLAAIGYDLRWTCLRASDVGAPHRRERWFGYATPVNADSEGWQGGESEGVRLVPSWRPLADAEGQRHWNAGATSLGGIPAASLPGREREAASHFNRDGLRQQPVRQPWLSGTSAPVEPRADNAAPDANGEREQQRGRDLADLSGRLDDGAAQVDWGQFGAAIQRWVSVLGRTPPEPTISGRNDSRVLNPRFVEWLMGLSAGWVTDVPNLSRTEMLRLLGNGVVPQQGEAAINWLASQSGRRETA